MSFLPYERLKDSGVEWLGRVPEHWEVKRIKHLIRSLDQGWSPQCESSPAESPDEWAVLKVGCVNGGSFQPTENKALPADLEPVPALSLAAGDVLISRANTRELVGSAAVALIDYPKLMVCDKLYRIRPKPKDCKSEFLANYLGTRAVRGQIELSATGASSSMLNIGQDTILDMPIALPPISEQLAIANFLDRETAKIDALVEEQRRLIDLLKEKRQALISHAVTKGLDPHAPIKDSRVEWLGQVPAHWDVKALKHLTAPGRDIMYGIVLPGPDVEEGVPIVKGGDVKEHRLCAELLCRTTAEIEAPYARARLRPNDIVYSIRGTIGDAELVPKELLDANITQDVARISPGSGVHPRWLLYAVRSRPVFVQLEQRSLGAAVRGINIYDLKRARVPVPPHGEQIQIAALLDHCISQFDGLVAEARRGIQLLQERRTALISAAGGRPRSVPPGGGPAGHPTRPT